MNLEEVRVVLEGYSDDCAALLAPEIDWPPILCKKWLDIENSPRVEVVEDELYAVDVGEHLYNSHFDKAEVRAQIILPLHHLAFIVANWFELVDEIMAGFLSHFCIPEVVHLL